MSIAPMTSAAPAQALQQTAPAQGRQDAGTASAGRAEGHHHHGGHVRGGHGGMMKGLKEALSALGLAPATAPAASAPSAGAADPTAAAGTAAATADGSSPAAAGSVLAQDEHAFLHALFGAMQDAAPASPGAAGARGTSGSSPEQKLSGLVGQVSAGNVPQPLQDAFDKLATDLQSQAASAGASAQVTLASLLEKMQSGMAQQGGASATGNIVNQVG